MAHPSIKVWWAYYKGCGEMADTTDLGLVDRKIVQVQVLPPLTLRQNRRLFSYYLALTNIHIPLPFIFNKNIDQSIFLLKIYHSNLCFLNN